MTLRDTMACLMLAQGASCARTAEDLGLSPSHVKCIARFLGHSTRSSGNRPEQAVVDRALAIIQAGGYYEDAADAVGVHKSSVGRWARKHGVPRKVRGRPLGMKWSRPSLRSRRVLKLREEGLTLSLIAERMGMCRDNVVKTLRRWLPRLEAA